MTLTIYAALWIPGPMPGLNEILGARGSVNVAKAGTHKRGNDYASLKREWTTVIQGLSMQARIRPGEIPACAYTFLHYERDQRRDPDNFCGGAQKLTLDALKAAGLIRNDGWGDVLGLRHHWLVRHAYDGRQAVGIMLYAASRTLEFEEATERASPERRRLELIPLASEGKGGRGRAARSATATSFARF
jgi:hypothetical protein